MLYIVATPIGNLGDITVRALEVLRSVDIIAAEDTRHTRKLLSHYNISTKLISYYEHKKREKGELVIKKLMEGNNVALVSDAGMPAISDPGEDLVRLCIENDIKYTVVPGASAIITALVMSGFSASNFSFEGFLTVKKSGKTAHLERIKHDSRTLVFYEAPHKLVKTLNDMLSVLGDRNIALCRELTKKYEEVIRGRISYVISLFDEKEPKGEFVIVVEGAKEIAEAEFEQNAADEVDSLVSSGTDKKTAIKQVAKKRGLSKRDVYSEYIKKSEKI